MVLTKRQKVMLGVLGLGAVALAVDKLMPGGGQTGPSTANAASATFVGSTVSDSPVPRGTGGRDADLLDNSVASQLDTLRRTLGMDLDSTKDAFCPSKTWLSALRPGDCVVTSSDEVRAIDFGRMHELKGIITSGDGGAAFIDDKYVRIGQIIDGFRLVKLGYRMVVFESNGAEVVLKLKSPLQDQ